MKKVIVASLGCALLLAACDKKPADTETPSAATETAPATQAAPLHTQEGEHKHGEHEHDHAEHAHDHAHGHSHSHDHSHGHAHDHSHDAGDAYQCGGKTVHIAIHDHEGEIEAHLTTDDITYDLNQDTANTKHFTTDNGIEGEDKPMTLVVDGNKAQVLKADNSVLLDCTKS